MTIGAIRDATHYAAMRFAKFTAVGVLAFIVVLAWHYAVG